MSKLSEYIMSYLSQATGFTITGGTTSKTLTVDETVAMSDKPTIVGWSDYSESSTIVGWVTFDTAKVIFTRKVGKLVFVAFWLDGTSNSATSSFTLPYTSDNIGLLYYGSPLTTAIDNAATVSVACRLVLSANSNICLVFKDMADAGWTTSLRKAIIGQFWYVIP